MTTENILALAGKVAVVTGGSSGIGAATVRRLAVAGARVVVGYNNGEARAAALIGEIAGEGHRAMRIPMQESTQIRGGAERIRPRRHPRQFGRIYPADRTCRSRQPHR